MVVQFLPCPNSPWQKTTSDPDSPSVDVCRPGARAGTDMAPRLLPPAPLPDISTSGGRRACSARGRGVRRRSGRPSAGRRAGSRGRGTPPPGRGARSGRRTRPHSRQRAHSSAIAKSKPTAVPSHGARFFCAAARPAACDRRTRSRANAVESRAVDQAAAAHERVEVVELDPGEPVGRAPVDPAADDPGQLAPLLAACGCRAATRPTPRRRPARRRCLSTSRQCWRQNLRSFGWVWNPLT